MCEEQHQMEESIEDWKKQALHISRKHGGV